MTVLKQARKNAAGRWYWLCSCKCGNKTEVLGSNLKHYKSCGCLSRSRNGLSDTTAGRIWKLAKQRAKQYNMKFDLRIEDVIVPECCPVLHIPIRTASTPGGNDSSPTLDRVDNKKGYVKGNVCVISMKANRLKGAGTAEDFRRILKYISRNTK